MIELRLECKVAETRRAMQKEGETWRLSEEGLSMLDPESRMVSREVIFVILFCRTSNGSGGASRCLGITATIYRASRVVRPPGLLTMRDQ